MRRAAALVLEVIGLGTVVFVTLAVVGALALSHVGVGRNVQVYQPPGHLYPVSAYRSFAGLMFQRYLYDQALLTYAAAEQRFDQGCSVELSGSCTQLIWQEQDAKYVKDQALKDYMSLLSREYESAHRADPWGILNTTPNHVDP